MTAQPVDAQTGAFERTHFERLVDAAARTARKSKAALSLLWVDVDELTEANDAHGVEAVDVALAALVQTLSEVLDGQSPIGRMAGGAFAALLPGLGSDQAMARAEAMRAAKHSGPNRAFSLHVSCGVATLKGDEPYGNLLEAAEVACTRAKQAGRDAVAKR